MERVARVAGVVLAGVLLVGCGSGDDTGATNDGPEIQEAGQVSVPVTEADDETTESTIPLAGDDRPAFMRMGDAFGAFMDCLAAEGYPDPDLSKAQTDFESLEPGLQDALAKCNNETGIAEIMQEMQKENENLTPEQIEQRNVGFLAFRECAVELGWKWPEPTPNEDGLLGMGGGGGGGAPEGPDGMRMDELIDECGDDAAKAVDDAGLSDVEGGISPDDVEG